MYAGHFYAGGYSVRRPFSCFWLQCKLAIFMLELLCTLAVFMPKTILCTLAVSMLKIMILCTLAIFTRKIIFCSVGHFFC